MIDHYTIKLAPVANHRDNEQVEPNFDQWNHPVGFGHSQQYDLAIPMAAILVSTNDKFTSAAATSCIDS